MADHPVVRLIKRGGAYRPTVLTQPHLAQGACLDVYRVAFVITK
jgi:hypothetical protein